MPDGRYSGPMNPMNIPTSERPGEDQAGSDSVMLDDLIENAHNAKVRRMSALLAHASQRRRLARFVVEGPQAVREAVRWRPELLSDVLVQAERGPDGRIRPASPVLASIAAEAVALQGPPYVHGVDGMVMRRMSHDAQGIAALADGQALMARLGAAGTGRGHDGQSSAAVPALVQPTGMIAAFWQVRDPGNAGTVIRTADAAGCTAVVFVDECVDVRNPKVVRSTAGSLFHIPVAAADAATFLAWCHGSGARVLAADVYGLPGHTPALLPELLRGELGLGRGPLAVLFGNEARGLEPDLLRRADDIVTIPLYGRAESMNLASSAAVLLHSLAMRAAVGESSMSSDVGKMNSR